MNDVGRVDIYKESSVFSTATAIDSKKGTRGSELLGANVAVSRNGDYVAVGGTVAVGSPAGVGIVQVDISDDGQTIIISRTERGTATTYVGNGAGVVQVLRYSGTGTTWNQIGQNIIGEQVGDEFGYSLSISGDGTKIAIGTNRSDNKGYVKSYILKDGVWVSRGSTLRDSNMIHQGYL